MSGPCLAVGAAGDFHLGHSLQGLPGEETVLRFPQGNQGGRWDPERDRWD